MIKSGLTLGSIVGLLMFSAVTVQADTITNSLVALEATSTDMMSLLTGHTFSLAPLSPQTLGQWTGSITSVGWTLQFIGVVDGAAAQITQTGTDGGAGEITWFDSGSLGAESINASGGFALDTQTPTAFSGDWIQCCTNGVQAQTTAGKQQLGAKGTIISQMSSAVYCNCYLGDNPFFWEYFDNIFSTEGFGVLSSTSTLIGPSSQFDVGITESGSLNLSTGVVSLDAVAATATPEPSTFALSIIALCWAYWRSSSRRRARHIQRTMLD
jgi:hypothetical protein